jgi:S-adenosyl methyltransferase
VSTPDFNRVADMLGKGLDPAQIRTDQPSPARIYDYWLGGKNYYAVDRAVAETILALAPATADSIRENRAFMLRAVRHLAEQGIDQFLDIGCGLPFSPNVHEIAQQVDPKARVAYVDSDPIVRAHAQALMESSDPEHIAVLHADARDPEAILNHPDARRVLDPDKPLGLLMVAVLHFIPDYADPARIVGRLMRDFPVGSHLVISHGTADFNPAGVMEATATYESSSSFVPRTKAAIEKLLLGMPLIAPGLVPITQWPDTSVEARAADMGIYGGIAVKTTPVRY